MPSRRAQGRRLRTRFPPIADWTDRLAILRSLHTTSNDHGVAGTVGLTGSAVGSVNLDGGDGGGRVHRGTCIGSIVVAASPWASAVRACGRFLGVGGRLHQGKRAITGEGGGALGALYDPFRLVYDSEHGTRIPALQLPANLSPPACREIATQLLRSLDQARHAPSTLAASAPSTITARRRWRCSRRRTRRACLTYPRNGRSSWIAMAERALGNRAFWPDGSSSMACRSCRSTGAIIVGSGGGQATAAVTTIIATSSHAKIGGKQQL